MKRDFSESAKTKLLGYVADVTETSTWGKIGDSISDATLHVSHWLGFLNVNKYIDNLDAYHKKIIDKNNTTAKQIEDIFANVTKIDSRYEVGINNENNYLAKMITLLDDLSDTINPSGGNLDMGTKRSILAADVGKLNEARETKQSAIEKNMLGTDPEAASTSIDPVNLSTGNYIYEHLDLSLEGAIPLLFQRYYNSKSAKSSSLGKGFTHNFLIYLNDENEKIEIEMEDGHIIHFSKEENMFIPIDTSNEVLEKGEDGYILTALDGSKIYFNDNNKISRSENSNGIGLTYTYNENLLLSKVETDYHAELIFEYNDNNLLKCVKDNVNREVRFFYENGRLCKVILPEKQIIYYEYNSAGRIIAVNNSDKKTLVKNEYDDNFRVKSQYFADGSSMFFEYDDKEKKVIQTERNGVRTVYFHDDRFRNTEILYEDGTTEKFIYNERNQCIRYIDRMGYSQRMSYDKRGNLICKIDAAKRKYNMTYDAYNRLLCMSLNGKRILENNYDRRGNLIYSKRNCSNGPQMIYDENGRMISIVYADGSKENLVYDERGNVVQIEDGNGSSIQYFYDELNQLKKVVDAMGNSSAFEYNQDGKVIKETNALGDSKTYTYNNEGLLLTTTDYNGVVTSRTYNSLNLLEKITDGLGFEIKYSYDSMWNIKKEVLPNGAVNEFCYDKNNNLSRIIDGEGTETSIEYNTNGEKISEIRGESKREFSYDAVGRLICVKNADGGIINYEYDLFDNIVKVTDSIGNYVVFEYDEDNRMTKEENNFGEIRIYKYNNMNEVEEITDEFGASMKYTYIPGGEKIAKIQYSDDTYEEYKYDPNKNLISFISRNRTETKYEYDALNRVSAVLINNNLQKKLAYDKVGNIVKIEDGDGNVTTYEYSLNNELIKVINPDDSYTTYSYTENGYLCKTTSYSANDDVMAENCCERNKVNQILAIKDIVGNVETYQYNEQGQLSAKIDRDGYITKYVYTNLGNVKEIEYNDGRRAEFSYNEFGHLQKIIDWNGITEIINDGVGRALSVKYPDGNQVFYEYNSAGKRTKVSTSGFSEVLYKYDTLQRLIEIEDDKDKYRYFYENGSLSKRVLPNGIEVDYDYDAAGLTSKIISKNANGIMDELLISYDKFGRKKMINKRRIDDVENNGLYEFEYDNMGRISCVKHNSESYHEYEYDAMGNILSYIDCGQRTYFKYNQLNQVMSCTTNSKKEEYSYDKRGNMTKIILNGETKYQYRYGVTNRIEESINNEGIITKYIYNGIGHKIQEQIVDNSGKVEHIDYLLDMTRQYDNVLEKNKNNVESIKFLWSNNDIIAMTTPENRGYFTQDEMGSSIRMTDSNSSTMELYGYDEFGRDLIHNENIVNPFGFTNFQRDDNCNMYYAQARQYAPSLCRFVSRDFVKGRVDSTLSQNEYIYCGDDPNNYEDRNGQFVLLGIIAAGAAIGAVASGAINAGTQAIKIAQGKQDNFNVGECLGSVVEGAVVGGVSAIPGVGFIGTVAAGAAGAAANSAITQVIDEPNHEVNPGKVLESAVVGGITSGVFYGLGKAKDAIKSKISGEKVKATTQELYKEAAEKVASKQEQIKGAIKATGRTSPHRLRQLAQLETEKSKLLQKFVASKIKKEVLGKSGILSPFKGEGVIGKALYTIFGLKATKSIFKDVVGRLIPWYSKDGEEKVPDYLKKYFETLYGKFTGKCPLYV